MKMGAPRPPTGEAGSFFSRPEKIRMVLKFDAGADGFLKMIYVLAGSAVLVLMAGGFFLFQLHREMNINF